MRAFIAGAAILASAGAAGAQAPAAAQRQDIGNSDETAMAVPRLGPPGGGVSLPRPLPPSEAVRIRRIFALHARGDMAEAVRETALLTDRTLLGSVTADRLLNRAWHPAPGELTEWLARYAGQPETPRIAALLDRKLPKGAPRPAIAPLPSVPQPASGIDPEELAPKAREQPEILASQRRAEQARALFADNRDREALDMAAAAFQARGVAGEVGLAGYVAGLAAWRLERYDLARTYFEDASRAEAAPPALRAAAAFWAARAHLRTRDPAGYRPWMRRAAEEPRTFYGQLARRTLGMGFGFDWDRETLGEADVEAIAATPEGMRAFALLQVNEPDGAEAELRLLWARLGSDPGMLHALLMVANAAELADFAAQLAAFTQEADGRPHDATRFPLPRLQPRGGFRVDPALVYGLARVESNFNPSAVSAVGARGLMQLMPITAWYIAHDPSIAGRLHDPAINLELGQRYVAYLGELDVTGNDLIRVLSCYNSGPGNFARWSARVHDGGDPLLFIEAIPNQETRDFVQHALAYSWVYAARLHRPAPGLDELAAGAFPRFANVTKSATLVSTAPRLH